MQRVGKKADRKAVVRNAGKVQAARKLVGGYGHTIAGIYIKIMRCNVADLAWF